MNLVIFAIYTHVHCLLCNFQLGIFFLNYTQRNVQYSYSMVASVTCQRLERLSTIIFVTLPNYGQSMLYYFKLFNLFTKKTPSMFKIPATSYSVPVNSNDIENIYNYVSFFYFDLPVNISCITKF